MKGREVQFLCVVVAVVALASCGGASHGDAGAGSFQCGSDAGGEATLSQVTTDGGVGIEQYVRAMAIARCDYWSRCSGLASYVANECVDALVAFGTWSYSTCAGNGSDAGCQGSEVFYPSTELLQAVDAGTVQYDSRQSGQCVAALLAEGCADDQLIEPIPACSGVFTCATDAGSVGAADGGADAGVSCAGLLFRYSGALRFFGTPPPTCSTAADCAGAVGMEGAESYCAAGFCSISPCAVMSAVCTAYAQVGQPCLGNALSIVHDHDPQTATETCAPGLACSGAVDGGAGTCVTPQEVGGSCARLADCKPGLACGCGICQIPPSAGPCADGLCKVGVAYCDLGSNRCQPVHALGDSCPLDAPPNYCGPGLACDTFFTHTCQPPG